MDEPEELTRMVDVSTPPINMADPDRFEYVVFRGQLWGDVHNVRTLHWRIAQALDAIDPARLRAAQYGGHITATKTPNTRYAPIRLPDGSYIYSGWATKWLMEVAQAWVSAFALDDEVRVKLLEPTETTEPPTGP
jgi:hypothetical protein